MSIPPDVPRTRTGLTVLEAEIRIVNLEAAIAQAILLLTQAANTLKEPERLLDTLLISAELLTDQLALEGMKHDEYVEQSLAQVIAAVAKLRRNIEEDKKSGNLNDRQPNRVVLQVLREVTDYAMDAAKGAAQIAEKAALAVEYGAMAAKTARLTQQSAI